MLIFTVDLVISLFVNVRNNRKMRTSTSQFEIMVSFMEQHGDISKPSSNARGRVLHLRLWEELAELLNSDGSGDTKTAEKWKKVWSDFKNNTKKKSARLHRSMTGTGGGPAILAKLSDIEQRVLQLVGIQCATGLTIEEAGLPQENPVQDQIRSPQPSLDEAGPSRRTHFAPPNQSESPIPIVIELREELDPQQVELSHVWPVPSPVLTIREEEVEGINVTPTRAVSPPQSPVRVQPQPSSVGHTPTQRGRRARRNIRSPRRLVRPTQIEQTSQIFLQADEEWRRIRHRQHEDYMDQRREQNRIREMELQIQRDWQQLGLRGMELMEKLVNKYCNC